MHTYINVYIVHYQLLVQAKTVTKMVFGSVTRKCLQAWFVFINKYWNITYDPRAK